MVQYRRASGRAGGACVAQETEGGDGRAGGSRPKPRGVPSAHCVSTSSLSEPLGEVPGLQPASAGPRLVRLAYRASCRRKPAAGEDGRVVAGHRGRGGARSSTDTCQEQPALTEAGAVAPRAKGGSAQRTRVGLRAGTSAPRGGPGIHQPQPLAGNQVGDDQRRRPALPRVAVHQHAAATAARRRDEGIGGVHMRQQVCASKQGCTGRPGVRQHSLARQGTGVAGGRQRGAASRQGRQGQPLRGSATSGRPSLPRHPPASASSNSGSDR